LSGGLINGVAKIGNPRRAANRKVSGLLAAIRTGGCGTCTGRGTTVTLRLPHGPARVGTVLIADDDAGFRAVLRSMLTTIATEIVEVPDGQQALAVLAERHVDLLLADMRMPGLDGSQLLAGVSGRVPAIVITAMDIEPPARATGLLRKEELTQDRLAFAIRRAAREAR